MLKLRAWERHLNLELEMALEDLYIRTNRLAESTGLGSIMPIHG